MNRPMTNNRRVHPTGDLSDYNSDSVMDQKEVSSQSSLGKNDTTSFNSSSDGSSYLKLKQFKKLDPTLKRLLFFLACFGVTVNFVSEKSPKIASQDGESDQTTGRINRLSKYAKILIMFIVCALSMEVVFDLDFTQSKLITEQKRSAPLLTFVIFGYSVTSLIIPIISDGFLILIGSHLFRFYSRTTATVCDGKLTGQCNLQ